MKRVCVIAVLMMCASSAHAGGSYSFKLGSHRVHIEKSRHCRLNTCISVSKGSRSLDWGRKRIDDGRDAAIAPKPVPAPPQVVSPPPPPAPPAPPPAATSPAKIIVLAPPPALQTASASRTIAEPPPPQPAEPPPARQASMPSLAPSSSETVGSVRPASKADRVSLQPAEESPDSPVGDWQTEAKGTVRIVRCGDALCGHAIGSSNEKGEAILINMKAKTNRQWSGSVYSQRSGDTYYGFMSMKGTDTLRVEACALYRFYCTGNKWSRITRGAGDM